MNRISARVPKLEYLYDVFERTCRTSLPKARRRDIVTAYEKINEQLGRLISADERFLERHAAVSTGSEPFVMRYVSEVLLEPDDPAAKLPEDEIGEIFICLQTVVDVLHDISVAELGYGGRSCSGAGKTFEAVALVDPARLRE